MKISKEQLHHLAQLAGLEIQETLEDHLTDDLQSIIGFMDALIQVDTQGVAPLCHPSDISHQPLRPDRAKDQNWQAEMAQQAPDFEKGYYLVPKVIESES
ncbi:Asp-tRNA(Asn)/Glu-tRNA(Gln) amidotransferase subunit GatC [Legionella sp. W05-934-2]|jgi:aspartyl-tRNA(Asn)/glutamyl-tRNA(Gln) amidotransferase subunit C|uniref:Asp-tRNA(Asn)/Glu-tRNA(Gln) amidotransferase subunit GatC n=1 Tax=Legionella sp. W05-934-2 TaxID=1198649 RepID=UPI0034628A6C